MSEAVMYFFKPTLNREGVNLFMSHAEKARLCICMDNRLTQPQLGTSKVLLSSNVSATSLQ